MHTGYLLEDWTFRSGSIRKRNVLKASFFSYVKGIMSAFLELDCLNIVILLLLLVAVAFDVVEHRRALTYSRSLLDILAHMCININAKGTIYNLKDVSESFRISQGFPDGNVFVVLKLSNIIVQKKS